MRAVRVAIAYTAFLLTLVLVQWRLKVAEESEKTFRLRYSDNIYAATIENYNACSPIQDKTAVADLPSAYTAFPIVHTEASHAQPQGGGCLGKFKARNHSELSPESAVCEKLFLGETLTEDDQDWVKSQNKAKPEDIAMFLRKTDNCSWIREEFSNYYFVTDAERDFPIAYAININQFPQQVFRFLKVIYRPHNVYCLHYDSKADLMTKQIMLNVASCLGNVIIPRKTENVYWGWYTLEEAYLSCFSDLMLARELYPWRYVITLCGKELPLRTNAEIVSILEPLNGTSSVELVGEDGMDEHKFKWKWVLNTLNGWITEKDTPLPPIPHDLKVYKSWAYVALSLQFVEHLLCSPVGRELRLYMRNVRIPEENLYAMLFMAPNTPGGYKPEQKHNIFPVISSIWLNGDHHGLKRSLYLKFNPRDVCSGWRLHTICILSAKDLHRLSYRPGIVGQSSDSYLHPEAESTYGGKDRGPLFHNKFNMELDRVVMTCMEGEIKRRNKLEFKDRCSVSS